jgi:UPF0716 family protein affecting phage T7 exclusion
MFTLSFVLSTALVSFVLIKLPANYFHTSHARAFWQDKHRAVRWSGVIIKNVVGVLIVVAGIIMSIPGFPGPGVLTILLGLVMLDIPGKRPLETKLVKRPAILRSINRLRARFDKPPLVVD